jgi:hypothetical protein
MARRLAEDEEWDEGEPDVRDDADASDVDESTIPCPYCKRHIHEDSQRCPYCEYYISKEDPPPARKPWWIILGTLLCLYIVYRWVVG